MTLLSSNQLFSRDDGTGAERPEATGMDCVRVLAVHPANDLLWYLELDEAGNLPMASGLAEFEERIESGELFPLATEPVGIRSLTDSQLSEKSRELRDKRLEKISLLVTENEFSILDPSLRHRLLVEASGRLKVSRWNLYTYLRLWWRHGQLPNALAPRFDRCGAPGKSRVPGAVKRGRKVIVAGTSRGEGVNITPEMAKKLQSGARFLKMGMSWKKAFDENAMIHFLAPGLVDGERVLLPFDKRPTVSQFKYYVSKVASPADIERATRGNAAFERNVAERTGYTRDVPFGPGSRFQIDATTANIYLRSRYDPDQLVGRPTLYLVVDQSSGMIVGFAAELGDPSWDVAKLALENAFTDKVVACRELGVEIKAEDWPCRFVTATLVGDRCWELLGANAGASGLSLKFVVENAPPYRPDHKVLVEGKFDLLDTTAIHWEAGATHGRNRGDPDDRPNKLDGFYDLDGFRKFMVHAIIRCNRTLRVNRPPSWFPMSSQARPTPLEIFNHGISARGLPKSYPREIIRANLLPEAMAKITDAGLKMGRLLYRPLDPRGRSMFDRIQGRSWNSVKVKYDPRNVGRMLVPDADGTFHEFVLVPADARFEGWSREEVAVWFARRLALDAIRETTRMASEKKFKDDTAALNRANRAEAKRKRDELGNEPPSGRKIPLSANKEARAAEVKERRREEAWLPDGGAGRSPPPPQALPAITASQAGARPPAPPKVAAPVKPNKLDVVLAAKAKAEGEKSK